MKITQSGLASNQTASRPLATAASLYLVARASRLKVAVSCRPGKVRIDRVMIRPNVQETRIEYEVANAIRLGAGKIRRRKVVPVWFNRLLCGKPLFAAIVEVLKQFLLFGVLRDYRHPRCQGTFHLDMAELRAVVGMIRTFLRYRVASQAWLCSGN
jgi:hypothetical protein